MPKEKDRSLIYDDGRPWVPTEEDRPSGLMPLVDNCVEDGRTIYGMLWSEITFSAVRWWNDTGRRVITNPEFKDPDQGLPSGIMRGLPADELTRVEFLRVVHVYERTQVRPQFEDEILAWMRKHHPEYLDLKDPRLNEWVPEDVRAREAAKQVVNRRAPIH